MVSANTKNEGTKLPSVTESTILMENKAGFRNVALSFSAVCGVPIALSGEEHGQRKHKNEGTKLGKCNGINDSNKKQSWIERRAGSG
jgi:hypothetical protein